MLPNRRLIRAEEAAELLIADLREMLTYTDETALEELVAEGIETLESIRRKLKTFVGRKDLDRRHDPKHQS